MPPLCPGGQPHVRIHRELREVHRVVLVGRAPAERRAAQLVPADRVLLRASEAWSHDSMNIRIRRVTT